MPRITGGTVLKLVIWSLVVGVLLAFLNITPQEIVGWVAGWVGNVAGNIQHYAGQAIAYILLGACVVVPIWLVSYVMRALKGRP